MKKLLLVISLFIALGGKSQGLVPDGGFDTWAVDTAILPAGSFTGIPADTMHFLEPAGWTTSNSITDLDSLGNHVLVTPDSTPQSGAYSIKMKTTHVVLVPTLAARLSGVTAVTLPGFVLNGKFPIGVNTLLSGGFGDITPMDVLGSGVPFTQKLASIGAYVNYIPSHNDSTHKNDSCLIYATLRHGTEVIANAIYKTADTTAGWRHVTIPFNYVSCNQPDTLVILMASSNLNLLQLASQGSSATVPGSLLSVDSISYDTLSSTYIFPVHAANDAVIELENSTNDTIKVTVNDLDCSRPLTVSISSGPYHGTATASDSIIIYTPTAGYTMSDTIVYYAHNSSGDSSKATVHIAMQNPNGISNLPELALNVYPVPTTSELNVNFNNPGRVIARVYDMIGNLASTTTFTSNNNRMDVQNLNNGVYLLEISDTEGAIIGRGKFTVSK